MKWIGLTGGLGTGKSTVADILRRKGMSVIDADRKAREALEPGTEIYELVIQHFGPDVLNKDQEIDRSKLAQRVFANPEEREWLEKIVHPAVQKSVAQDRAYLQDQGLGYAFYDVPLLYEKHLESQFDAVILVYAPQSLQIERVLKRNQWSPEEVRKRIESQIDIEEKRSKTKYVILNDGDPSQLEAQVVRVLGEIKADLEGPTPA